MNMMRGVLAVGVLLAAAGCGGPSLKDAAGGLPGWISEMGGQKAQAVNTPAERTLKRFGLLQEEEICVSCWVTGGGAGNVLACSDGQETAKFGLVADPGGKDGTGGHLQFQLENELGDLDQNLGGKVDAVRCIEIYGARDGGGDTWGKLEFFGTLKKETGLDTQKTWTFHVVVEDYGEPNVAGPENDKGDHLWIDVVDEQGNHAPGYPFECDTDDGNIQLHPTRAAQL